MVRERLSPRIARFDCDPGNPKGGEDGKRESVTANLVDSLSKRAKQLYG